MFQLSTLGVSLAVVPCNRGSYPKVPPPPLFSDQRRRLKMKCESLNFKLSAKFDVRLRSRVKQIKFIKIQIELYLEVLHVYAARRRLQAQLVAP